jgi:hypothetical protein
VKGFQNAALIRIFGRKKIAFLFWLKVFRTGFIIEMQFVYNIKMQE